MQPKPIWTDLTVAVTISLCAVIVAFDPAPQRPPAWAVLVAFAGLYYAFGRRLVDADRMPHAAYFIGGVALLAGLGTLADPSMAFLQLVAYPLAWFVAPPRRRLGVLFTVMIGVAVATGYLFGPGGLPSGSGGVFTTALIGCLSIAFSLAMGLWIGRVFDYAHERARLVDELTAAQDELTALHRQAGETSERARLARELHDTVTQSLTGLVMMAEQTGRTLQAGASGAGAAELARSVALIESTAREALAEARALVATMTPIAVDSGLAEAMARLGARFTRETGIPVETRVCERRIAREHEVVLLRCAQEGLSNVRKHAHAGRVAIELTARAAGEGDELVLTVSDDGVGVAAAGHGAALDEAGFGVAGMRERVAMLGGRLDLGPRRGGGAELAVVLPVAAGA